MIPKNYLKSTREISIMKTCQIVPIPHLETVKHDQYHLLLSHLVPNTVYKRFYQDLAKQKKYLILDNSAHELGEGGSISKLYIEAMVLGAKELVLPDVLDNSQGTIELGVKSLYSLSNLAHDKIANGDLRLMIVPQGKTIEEWEVSLWGILIELFRLWPSLPVTIGITKDSDKYPGLNGDGVNQIIGRYILPLIGQFHGQFEIHLLGWGRNLAYLSKIRDQYPIIRSTDSAKPWVYAMEGIKLDYDNLVNTSPYPSRPKNFFTTQVSQEILEMAEHNIDVFKRTAGHYDG